MSILGTMGIATALLLFAGDALSKKGCWLFTALGVVELLAGLYFMIALVGKASETCL